MAHVVGTNDLFNIVQHFANAHQDRLKDGVFHGRRIMFDDRNMTNPIMVKGVDLNESPVPVPSRARGPDVGTASYQQTGLYPHDSFSEPSYAQVRVVWFMPLQCFFADLCKSSGILGVALFNREISPLGSKPSATRMTESAVGASRVPPAR